MFFFFPFVACFHRTASDAFPNTSQSSTEVCCLVVKALKVALWDFHNNSDGQELMGQLGNCRRV